MALIEDLTNDTLNYFNSNEGFQLLTQEKININVLGLSVPQALIAGAGISVITSLISYNEEKRKVIRDNPYSYLLAINNEIGK